MATVTATKVKSKALGILGVTAIGQLPEDDDLDRIGEFYSPVLASLAAREIIYVGDPDEVPEEYYLQIASCLAYAAMTEFGVSPDDAQNIERGKARAESELKEMLRGRPTYQPALFESI